MDLKVRGAHTFGSPKMFKNCSLFGEIKIKMLMESGRD